jgi:2-iminoacetate synthase
VLHALDSAHPGVADFAALLSPAAGSLLEEMAIRARNLTQRHFGNTVSLYVPLYLSNHCSSECTYCGFSRNRNQSRMRLEKEALLREMDAIRAMGFEEVLLLTGDRISQANFEYLRNAVELAARRFASVAVEAFAMTAGEYRILNDSGAVAVTLYQETYDPIQYERLHISGPKRNYSFRFEAPVRALEAGIRFFGLGVLFGLADPRFDALCLYLHACYLRRRFWQSGVALSFPRVCAQEGGFTPFFSVNARFLAQIIFAFRICLPDVPLVLSTREAPHFRDGIAGIGISKMSIASRTTVGGYGGPPEISEEQFHISDERNPEIFCAALRAKGIEPVFKNWDSVYRQ